MNNNISTTNYDILLSGIVIVPSKEEVQFKLDNLLFNFKFENDTENKQSRFVCDAIEKTQTMNISLFNMSKSINATNVEIMKLGCIKDRDLYLKFCITAINSRSEDCDYSFQYTWYLKK